MFGIGLPEMLLIMALALIVIGPDKLPDLARSLAKGLLDLKKTAESLKTSLAEEGNPLADLKPELEEAAKSLKSELLDPQPQDHDPASTSSDPAAVAAAAYQELLKQTAVNNASIAPPDDTVAAVNNAATPEEPEPPEGQQNDKGDTVPKPTPQP